MERLKFFILLMIIQTFSYTVYTNFTEHLKKKIQSNIINDKNSSFAFYNKTIEGNIPQLYDSALADSPELIAHQNRVFKCSDHPQVSDSVCGQSKDPCFCVEHEAYTYSFCRKSCGYCGEEETTPREYWRVRALSASSKPLMIESLLFLHSAISLDAVTTQHRPSVYMKHSSKHNHTNHILHSNGWFEHKMNRYNSRNDTYVGYKFGYPIVVNGIIAEFGHQNNHSVFVVEAASSMKGPFMKRWIFRTIHKPSDNLYYKRNCPVLWKKYETAYKTFCVKLMANFTTWNDARTQCKNMDSELLSITDKDENDFIKEHVRPCGQVWIGYNDIEHNGNFVWSDGPGSYENWISHNPTSSKHEKSEDCIIIDKDGKWSTDLCSNSHYYFCKKQIDNIPDVKYDDENINIDAPMLFFADDFSTPLLNTSETNQRKMKEDAYFDIRLANHLPHEQSPQK